MGWQYSYGTSERKSVTVLRMKPTCPAGKRRPLRQFRLAFPAESLRNASWVCPLSLAAPLQPYFLAFSLLDLLTLKRPSTQPADLFSIYTNSFSKKIRITALNLANKPVVLKCVCLLFFKILFIFLVGEDFLIVFFPLLFIPHILSTPQSLHCCPCPWIPFPFWLTPPLPMSPHSCRPVLSLWVCPHFTC